MAADKVATPIDAGFLPAPSTAVSFSCLTGRSRTSRTEGARSKSSQHHMSSVQQHDCRAHPRRGRQEQNLGCRYARTACGEMRASSNKQHMAMSFEL
eukprot:11226985-Alexandrium_andersonii.AAC.1